MPLKVTRRPYTDCPHRWHLAVEGVSGGEGSVSEASCLELVGEFDLDFKSCQSQHGVLVWEGDCEPSGLSEISPCSLDGCEKMPSSIAWTPPNFSYDDTGASLVWDGGGVAFLFCYGTGFRGFLTFDVVRHEQTGQCLWFDTKCGTITTSDPEGVEFPPPTKGDGGVYDYWRQNEAGEWVAAIRMQAELRPQHQLTIFAVLYNYNAPFPFNHYYFPAVVYRDDTGSCVGPATYSIDSSAFVTTDAFTFSDPVTVYPKTSAEITGPEQGDRIRSKWHLEYIVAETKWVLRSFNRIDYPVYALVDASPCSGDEKTLVLQERPTGSGDGCAIAPPSVTITRACPTDRVANEHQRSKMTGQIRRACGCACDDEVDDRRHTCQSKCTSTSTTGCESYSSDGIECKYPKPLDCCDYCTEDKTPCAYEAMFDCEIKHNGVSIAAPVVTLRKDCYFENACEYVAVGPSPNAADGGTGAQPVCATCSDSCLSGCSWDAWQTAACPQVGPCGGLICDLSAVFDAAVGPMSGTDALCSPITTTATTINLPFTSSGWFGRDSAQGIRLFMELRNDCLLLSLYPPACAGLSNGVFYVANPTHYDSCPSEITFEYSYSASGGAVPPDVPRTIVVTRI